jgi:hypothetical protein
MLGHGWPLLAPCEPEPWEEEFGVVVDGVVVVGDVVLVDGVVVELLGAAAAPAMPATAPPLARAPTTSPVRIMFALFIREPPMVAGVADNDHAAALV